MAAAMSCAACGPPVPANVLLLHPGLFQIAIPLCSFRPKSGEIVVPIDSPEAGEVLDNYTLAPGYILPRRMP